MSTWVRKGSIVVSTAVFANCGTSWYIFSMKLLTTILILLLLAVTLRPVALRAQATDSMSLAQIQTTPPKNPELAGTLSWIFPGLGQVYNGRVGRGLLQMELFAGGIAMIAGSQIGFSHASITPAAWISVGIVAGTFVWSVIDAVLTAEGINSEWRARTQSQGNQGEGNGLKFNISITKTGAMAGIAMTF